jgi:VWFA-related protein
MQREGVGMFSGQCAGRKIFSLLTGGIAAAVLLLSQGAPTASGQNPFSTPAPDSTPTFKSSSRLVVVDVVVTGRDGNPIAGLDKADFTVLEDGKVQPLQSFEPHVPVKETAALPEIQLPAGEFTNFPKQAANSAVNIVLFDILNTPTDDQMFARQQMIEFLKTLPRGQRVALFTLGYDLKMIAGFTTSTDDLIAAANKVKPGVSALLDTEQDLAAEDHMQSVLTSGMQSGGGGDAVNMASAMTDFTAETRLVRTDIRTEKTFESLGALARALSGYTGRKNLLWLSEGFPAAVLPRKANYEPDARNYLATFQKYSGLLEASQISVYPIDVRGLKNTSLSPIGGSAEYDDTQRQTDAAGDAQLMMRDVAGQTGGRAFYNGNDLKGAMRRSIEHGSTYYTLAYSPQNKKWDGKFRKIEVKLARPDTHLDYRRGYYGVSDDPGPVDTARRMLIAEMQPGVPQSTMLLLRCRVVPDNNTGKVSIDYGVYAADIAFTGDALKHAQLEFVAVAWGKDEKAAGNVSQTVTLDPKPETLQKMLNTGVPFHQELTLKPGTYHLRLGVMDYTSAKIGTLEIPVTIGAARAALK